MSLREPSFLFRKDRMKKQLLKCKIPMRPWPRSCPGSNANINLPHKCTNYLILMKSFMLIASITWKLTLPAFLSETPFLSRMKRTFGFLYLRNSGTGFSPLFTGRIMLEVIPWLTVCNLSIFSLVLSVSVGNMCSNVLDANGWLTKQLNGTLTATTLLEVLEKRFAWISSVLLSLQRKDILPSLPSLTSIPIGLQHGQLKIKKLKQSSNFLSEIIFRIVESLP